MCLTKQIRRCNTMKEPVLSVKDMREGKEINSLFEQLGEKGKLMAVTYISALRDKELADKETTKLGLTR